MVGQERTTTISVRLDDRDLARLDAHRDKLTEREQAHRYERGFRWSAGRYRATRSDTLRELVRKGEL